MRRVLILVLIAFLNTFLMGSTPFPSENVVRVGFYENAPKLYLDPSGRPAGFWPDLMEAVAKKEGFRIEWVRGTWDENLHRLEREQIDVMPDVGFTPVRANQFAFNAETVLTSWARLYRQRGAHIETIFDLEGKTVAGLRGSLNFDGPEGIKNLTEKFNVHSEFKEYATYEEVFAAVRDGLVDAGITNKDFGDLNEGKYGLERSPIILQPTDLRFAFPKHGALTPWLIETIDRDLKEMLADPTSAYYQALEKHFGQNLQQTFLSSIPTWVYETLGLCAAAALILLAATILARRQIRRQTAELRASTDRYQALLAHNPDPILRLRRDGWILDYHSSDESLLHMPQASYEGRNVTELLNPAMGDVVMENVRKTLASGEMQSQELTLLIGDRLVDIETRYARSGSDEVIAILRDITDRKQAEREVQESQRRYQTLTDMSPVGIFHTDRDGHTTYVNPTWCRIAGLPTEEALGDGWLRAVHPEDRERLAVNWQEAAQNQDRSLTDYRFLRPDGDVVWVMGQAVPERDSNNDLIGFVGTITDITERKKVEALQLAVVKAESADRLKSAFLATMSHELRTPLNSIIGFTGILLQKLVGPLSAEQEKQLAMIQSSAHHLLELINDVLDISKIEAGQLTMACETFDMAQAIQKSLDKIRPLALKKGLELDANIEPAEIMIESDRRRVEQVLLNLLNNGVKFTERGGVRLECGIEDDRGEWLTTRVIDTGIGIKEESVSALFKPFQQVDSGLTRQYEGTGLGLSICKRLVELLGGSIWVDSVPGQGSTFTFTLPLRTTEHTEKERKDSEEVLTERSVNH